jgi:hypothetical protein
MILKLLLCECKIAAQSSQQNAVYVQLGLQVSIWLRCSLIDKKL